MINAKSLDHLIESHHIIFGDTPTHQCNPVQYSFRDISQTFEVIHKNRVTIFQRGGCITLAHLTPAAWLEKDRKVHPDRFIPTKRAYNLYMQRKSWKPLSTSYHMC